MVDIYKNSCKAISGYKRPLDKQSSQCCDVSYFMLELLSYIKFFDSTKPDDDEENFTWNANGELPMLCILK